MSRKICKRTKLESLVWKHTHKDFRGTLSTDCLGPGSRGKRSILHPGKNGGTELWLLSDLTIDQLRAKLPARVREEYDRGA